MNDNIIPGEIFVPAFLIAIIFFVPYAIWDWNNDKWEEMLKAEARHCLHEVKEDYTTTIRGKEAIVDYEINGYMELVKVYVPSKEREEFASDYNKSRILGEWAGEKSTEFLKGFFKGKEKESKFPDYED